MGGYAIRPGRTGQTSETVAKKKPEHVKTRSGICQLIPGFLTGILVL
jgi:hypothetical protein